LLRLQRLERLEAGEFLEQIRDYIGNVTGARPQNGKKLLRVAFLDVGTNGLEPGPVGRGALLLVAPTPEGLGAALFCAQRQLTGGARLADTGLSGQHDQASPSGKGVVKRNNQAFHFALAANEEVAERAVLNHLPPDGPFRRLYTVNVMAGWIS